MNFSERDADSRFTGSPHIDRQLMIEYLINEGISDERTLETMALIPRHRFVDEALWEEAYENRPLSIDSGQTISQPYIVALMTQNLGLTLDERVLEIGTGSGYQTAILAELAKRVFTVERIPELSNQARRRLTDLGFMNVEYKIGDGTMGWPENGPYDVIIATGAVPEIPASLLDQLRTGGRIVIPVGNRQVQKLILASKDGERLRRRELCYCSFLPLLGREGWPGEQKTSHS